MIGKLVLAAMMSASFGGITLPAAAATIVRMAPPPMRSEATPAPRRGHVWVAGHWDWKNDRHQWIKGSWLRDRRGYQYSPPLWFEREGQWHMQSGAWRRADRDGDGIPNRADRDRDGDGVRNTQDRRPNDPRRY